MSDAPITIRLLERMGLLRDIDQDRPVGPLLEGIDHHQLINELMDERDSLRTQADLQQRSFNDEVAILQSRLDESETRRDQELQQAKIRNAQELQQAEARRLHELQQLESQRVNDLQQIEARRKQELRQLEARRKQDLQQAESRRQVEAKAAKAVKAVKAAKPPPQPPQPPQPQQRTGDMSPSELARAALMGEVTVTLGGPPKGKSRKKRRKG